MLRLRIVLGLMWLFTIGYLGYTWYLQRSLTRKNAELKQAELNVVFMTPGAVDGVTEAHKNVQRAERDIESWRRHQGWVWGVGVAIFVGIVAIM